MKLTYEQMRQLSELGGPTTKVVIKNRKGQVIRPREKKWGPSPQAMKSKSMGGLLRPSLAHSENPSQIYQLPSSSQHLQLRGRR